MFDIRREDGYDDRDRVDEYLAIPEARTMREGSVGGGKPPGSACCLLCWVARLLTTRSHC